MDDDSIVENVESCAGDEKKIAHQQDGMYITQRINKEPSVYAEVRTSHC